MGRVSQAQAQENRRRIVATAARLFRERGVAGVSVADVMAEVGLTHGGFYKQFASKDALVAEAVEQAFAELRSRLTNEPPAVPGERSAGHLAETALATFVGEYLSAAHRDNPGVGCPAAGFGGDLAREAPGNAAAPAFADGVEFYARLLGSDIHPDLTAVSTLVGAMVLARATAGTDLSDRILAAARTDLSNRILGTDHTEADLPATNPA